MGNIGWSAMQEMRLALSPELANFCTSCASTHKHLITHNVGIYSEVS